MKRIISVLVAVLLLSSCFLSLPVLADGTGTSGEPVEVANIDFAKKYQDLNLTQPTDANGLENLGIGVADKGTDFLDLALPNKGLRDRRIQPLFYHTDDLGAIGLSQALELCQRIVAGPARRTQVNANKNSLLGHRGGRKRFES